VKRRLLNLLTLLSLLLFMATALVWVRGLDEFVFTAGGRLFWVMCGSGRLHVLAVEGWPGHEPFRWVADNSDGRLPLVTFEGSWSEWRRFGLEGEYGFVTTRLRPNGTPVSRAEERASRDGVSGYSGMSPMRFGSVFVTFWMPALLTGALPFFVLARWAGAFLSRRRRRSRGLCERCCYDLRGNVSGACPECGTAVIAKA
jgi:hypothetical protein